MEGSLVALLGKHILDQSIVSGKVSYHDDDPIDRLNHVYTTALIGICVSFMFTRQIIGKPISCWLPSEFSNSQVQYAEQVCWVMSTYYMKLEDDGPFYVYRNIHTLHYYQWIPFIIIGQASLYMIPYVFWCLASRNYRGQLILAMETLLKIEINTPNEQRIQHLNSARKNIHKILRVSRFQAHLEYRKRSVACRSSIDQCCGAGSIVVVIFYLCSKTLYLVNSLVQLIIMSKYLQINNVLYGLELFINFFVHRTWNLSSNFPRVSFCDFEIFALGQSLKYTSQCVLVVNMFNEKVYLLLWLWNVLLIIVNFYSFINWCYRSASNSYRDEFVKRLLNQQTTEKSEFPTLQKEFIHIYLRHDGSFFIQLIHRNLGQFITSSFVQFLWDRFTSADRKKMIKTPIITKNNYKLQDLQRGISSVSYNETFHTSKL